MVMKKTPAWKSQWKPQLELAPVFFLLLVDTKPETYKKAPSDQITIVSYAESLNTFMKIQKVFKLCEPVSLIYSPEVQFPTVFSFFRFFSLNTNIIS